MTPEELQALVDQQAHSIEDLTAERDSFRSENDTLKNQLAAARDELQKTKELNFTLSRRIDGGKKKTLEENLAEVFG